MRKISDTFEQLRAQGKTGLVPYITAGDPHLEATWLYLDTLVDAGADLIEIGVPFSDPVADGPVNQAAAERALASGTTLDSILSGLAARKYAVPLILFTYYNPLFRMGLATFAQRAKQAGISGVLTVDLPPKEGQALREQLHNQDIDSIYLATPTTSLDRLNTIDKASSGAVYYVARTGVTGKSTAFDPELITRLAEVKETLSHPLMVGFGIGRKEQIEQLKGKADALVVGSALVKRLASEPNPNAAAQAISQFIKELKAPLKEN